MCQLDEDKVSLAEQQEVDSNDEELMEVIDDARSKDKTYKRRKLECNDSDEELVESDIEETEDKQMKAAEESMETEEGDEGCSSILGAQRHFAMACENGFHAFGPARW